MFPLLTLLTLALGPAVPGDGKTTLTVSDPVLVTSSADSGDDTIEGVLGNTLQFEIQGPPTGPVFLGFSPKPPFGAGSINGVPIQIDPATAFYPVFGTLLSFEGHFSHPALVPDGLQPGTSFWSQAAVLDTGGGQLVLTNGVRIDLREPYPGELPLLAPGPHVGLRHTTPSAGAAAALDLAWQECLTAGVDGFELDLAWTDIELAPGMFSSAELVNQLAHAKASGLIPYLNLTTIDGLQLTLPADLLDPADPGSLAPGLTWDSALVSSRFQTVLDVVTPSLVADGGFFLGVGDEVDLYLESRPDQVSAFAGFVHGAATYVHATQPKLGVGVSLTHEAALAGGPILTELRTAADNLAWTYHPLGPGHKPRDPSVVAAELDFLVQTVEPKPLILQEASYPSGYLPTPGNGSSLSQQRAFVEQLFAAVASQPRLRYLGLVQLADVDAATATAEAAELGSADPVLIEHFATRGLRDHLTGLPKPAYVQLLLGLALLP